jgi:CheY-like chemotaxis protein
MGRPTVLLVDDDPDIRALLAGILCQSFYLLVATEGAEAIRIITDWQVDLLLTDIAMPRMDGLDLAEQALSMCPGLRVVYMTGYSDRVAHGTTLHGRLIPKPFRVAELVSEIKSALAA